MSNKSLSAKTSTEHSLLADLEALISVSSQETAWQNHVPSCLLPDKT